MLLLAFDTAGPDCAVALARKRGEGGEILARRSERIGRGHAERLIPMIDEVLAEGGATYGGIGRTAVTTGPGSFTGVRVGVAAARALALALDIEAVGVGSLRARARAAGRVPSAATAVATFDAKRGEVYVYAEDVDSGAVLIGPLIASVEASLLRLAALPRPLVLIGSGAPLLSAALELADTIVAGAADSPDIADVALIGLSTVASQRPRPLYLRGADAKPQTDKAVALR